MLTTIIVDDEPAAIQVMTYMLGKFPARLKIVATASNSSQAVLLINQLKPDVLFLDINMPELNGFQLFEKLEHRSFSLVFCTGSDEYGLKALKCNAIDYVLKPIDIAELAETVTKIEKNHKNNLDNYEAVLNEMAHQQRMRTIRISLPSIEKVEYTRPTEIMYIEADGKNCRVTLAIGEPLVVSKSLKEYESLLCHSSLKFHRLHHSFIVNLDFVSQYLKEDGGYVVIKSRRIPVSKQHRLEVMAELSVPA